MTNKRYMTPLKYTDGNGKTRTTKVYFELDPIELVDWTFENPYQAAELRDSLSELEEIEREDSRDLTQPEIRMMLGVIKLLSQISAGKPDDSGDYFHKDPSWTSSYAYRAFRVLLLTNAKETETFLKTLLDNDTMEKFNQALAEGAAKAESTATTSAKTDGNNMSQEELFAMWKAREDANKNDSEKPGTE